MRKRRYTEAQIVAILKELDAGRPAAELARKHGVHVNTLRSWRDKYGGLVPSNPVESCAIRQTAVRRDGGRLALSRPLLPSA